MMRNWTLPLCLALSMAALPVHADQIVLGDAASEQTHEFKDDHSESTQGGLDETARRLLPLSPESFDGGSITFTMTVDPQAQNYVTVKLWGSDKGQASGRLVLYAEGLQVGYRHEGDYDVLNQCDDEGEAPGRFFYQTVPLPLSLTQGKNSISLKIAALGPMWPYGQTFEKYQKPLAVPSRGIYRIYTHTAARFVPDASERQGQFPQASTRPGPGEEVIEQSKKVVIDRLARILQKPVADEKSRKTREARLPLLAEAYNTRWTPAFHSEATIEQIVLDGDSTVAAAAIDKNYIADSWLGVGPVGEAMARAWPAIEKRMDEPVTINGREMPRRVAWADALRQSVDYWRTHRRAYTNQSMIVDMNIYSANRGLQLIDPKRALSEAQVIRYLHEAVGIEPWLGSDASDDVAGLADVPGKGKPKCFGENYSLVTRKGLSRELGWVGTYGETVLRFMHDMVEFTGDEKIRQQLAKIERARLYFRYPGVDADGYRCMKLVSEVDNRTAHYPLSGAAYNAPSIREEWWMDVPAMLSDDPVVVGITQQMLADNQYFAYVQGRLKDVDTLGMMRNVDQYAKVKSLPTSTHRLPMTDGQPDFTFADEEDAIVAIKHGDTRLFVNLYYRAERAVNGVARLYEQTPTITRIATVRTQAQAVPGGQTYKRPDWIDGIRSKGLPPPGQEIHQAWAGEEMPVSPRPKDASQPADGDWGPFLGKAQSYRLQYGDYFIVMNCSEDKALAWTVPPQFAGGQDLVSGKPASDLGSSLKPLSTVVLFATQTAEK